MKGLNVKKLAAVATGAALIGTALAPVVSAISIDKSDIYDSSGSPAVNIVVGSAAQVSDVVWAGNIAVKIAEKAGAEGSCTAEASGGAADAQCNVSDLSVNLSLGGTTTYENAKEYKTEDLNSASPYSDNNKEFFGKVLSDSQLSHLVNKSTTMKWAGSNYSRTFKEEIGVDADVRFDAVRPAVQDLVAYMDLEGDFNYCSDLGDGIYTVESETSATNYTDGTNDNVKIPFFGEDYLVSQAQKASGSSNTYVKLLKSSAKETYNEGDIITGLTGKGLYEGQDMTVKVVQVIQVGSAVSTYQATFELYDAEGTLVDTRTVSAGEYLNETFVDSNDDYSLSSTLYVDTVAIASTTNIGYVDVLKGTNVVELYDTKGYPYDSTDTGPYDWKVSISLDGNMVDTICIVNSSKLWNDTNPVYAQYGALTSAGQDGPYEVGFLEGLPEGTDGKDYAKVTFQGLEQDESNTQIKIGEKSNIAGYEVPTIQYTDSTDADHTIPMYIQLPATTTGSTFEFDGQTIYYIVNKGDNDADANATSGMVDLNVAKGDTVNGVGIDVNFGAGVDGGSARADVTSLGTNTDMNVQIQNFDLNVGNTGDLNGMAFQVKDTNACGSFNTTAAACTDTNHAAIQFDGNVMFRKSTSTGEIFSTTAGTFVSTTDMLTSTWYYDDLNTSGTLGPAFYINPVWLRGANDKDYKYALAVSETYNKVYLLLDQSTAFDVQYDKDIKFNGTDRFEGGMINTNAPGNTYIKLPVENWTYPSPVGAGADANSVTYFYPDELEFSGSSSDNSFMVASIGIETDDEDGATYDANVYVDTRSSEGGAITLPNNNLSVYTSDVNVNAASGGDQGLNVALALDEDSLTTTQPDKAYNDFGAKYEVEDGIVTVTIPENRPKPILLVKSTSTTTVSSGGEELTIAKGETGTSLDGTTITIDEVTYSAECENAEGETTCSASPESYTMQADVANPLVYLDRDAPIGPNVIVGGPIVNTLAASVAGLADRLVASGDTVAEVTDTGDIVVAGYTGADTGRAAQELIDALDAM